MAMMDIHYEKIFDGRYYVYVDGKRLGEVLGGFNHWVGYRWDDQIVGPYRTRKAVAIAMRDQAISAFPEYFAQSA